MLRELQKYTVGISEVQKERLNNAIYQISDEEILALSKGITAMKLVCWKNRR